MLGLSRSVQQSFQPVEAANDVVGVITRVPLHIRVDAAGGICCSAPHPALDPPQRGTQQCHGLPPIDAVSDVT